MYDSSGSIIFNATSASGSLPVKNTLIRISGADEENRFTVYSLITDEDGVTEPITLPAPSIALSLSPGPGERPYALYNVEVSANGYYPKRIFSIEVFPNTKSIQPINMIPLSEVLPYIDYPKGNLSTTIPENHLS